MAAAHTPHHGVSYVLGHAALGTVGFVCALVGIVLCATLWLMPVGLPLALVGVAIMEAAGECH